MAQTVDAAFREFLAEEVNLDANKNRDAKASRDWLVDRVHEFPERDVDFPYLNPMQDIFFGSFARRTKKRPLDDIDMMLCLTAGGAWYSEYGKTLQITVPEHAVKLRKHCFDNSSLLNSRKVINKFVSLLGTIPQYEKADIKRNFEAVTLKLKSYDWNFDIVPCFITQTDDFGNSFYVIPDGQGHWKKTDPRIDRDRVTRLNRRHDNLVLNIIRLVKFWNGRPTMPSIPSYTLENMVLDLYEYRTPSAYIDIEFPYILEHLGGAIFRPVQDPKGFQGDLNNLGLDDQIKISVRCNLDKQKAQDARMLELEGDHRKAINKWKEIFGDRFPTYE